MPTLGVITETDLTGTSRSWPWFSPLGGTDHFLTPAQASSSSGRSEAAVLGVPSTFGDF